MKNRHPRDIEVEAEIRAELARLNEKLSLERDINVRSIILKDLGAVERELAKHLKIPFD